MTLRFGPATRAIAFAAALSISATGSGLPMCLSLLGQATAPCQMHARHHEEGTDHRAPQSGQVTSHVSGEACHPDSTAPACTTGGGCPTGGPAVGVSVQVAAFVLPAAAAALLAPASSYLSYSAPPLSPPPQA